MTATASREPLEALDAAVRAVAALLPAPARVDAQMGGTGVLQIVLGEPDSPDEPYDCAGIDLEDNVTPSLWWVDIGGGEATEVSHLGPSSDPKVVAAWISEVHQTLSNQQSAQDL